MAAQTAPTYTKTGSKAPTGAKLNPAVFAVAIENHDLLKAAYVSYLAQGREHLAVTKTRGLVRGGGKKPWKQKGTGRARFGSSRVPIWRGGGVVFGPTGNENYAKKMHVAAKRQAIRQALSIAASESRIRIVETIECKDGKVKPILNLLGKIDAEGRVLLVASLKDDLLERATRNLPRIKAVQANYLNTYDILNADTIVISHKALEMIEAWLGGTK